MHERCAVGLWCPDCINLRPFHDPAEIHKQSHFIWSTTVSTIEAPPIIATETQQILFEMLTENTGRHMLDSGSAYGRNWERNRRKTIQDFLDEEWSTLQADKYGIEITHSVFHWLDHNVEYESNADHVFEQWGLSGERKDAPWMPLMEEFAELIGGRGLYGDGQPITVNTYNGEDLLSQVLQYTYFELDEPVYLHQNLDGEVIFSDDDDEDAVMVDADAYALIQIHGGCDVRGGYTRPRLFRVMEEMALFDNARAAVGCSGCDYRWFTDNGYDFYSDADEPELRDLEHFEHDGASRGWARAALLRVLHDMGEDLQDWGIEHQLVHEDDVLYCPESGHPLNSMFF